MKQELSPAKWSLYSTLFIIYSDHNITFLKEFGSCQDLQKQTLTETYKFIPNAISKNLLYMCVTRAYFKYNMGESHGNCPPFKKGVDPI